MSRFVSGTAERRGMTRTSVGSQRQTLILLMKMLEQAISATIQPGCVNMRRATSLLPDKHCCCDPWYRGIIYATC